jgi:hypothetical protein
MFERLRIGVPAALANPGHEGFVLRQAESPRRLLALLKDAVLEPPDLPALQLSVEPPSMVSVTGAPIGSYSFNVWAEHSTGSQEGDERSQLIQLTRRDEGVALTAPEEAAIAGYWCYLDAVGPADRPVTIHADWAAIDVFDVRAPVRISSSHGRVAVLNTSDHVDVTAEQGGSIVWSGSKGQVRLEADLGIDLKLTEPHFVGTVNASSDGGVRVLLPQGFTSSVRVQVCRDDEFRCDADVKQRFVRTTSSEHVTFTCGSGPAVLQLTSREKTVIIETY